MGSASLLLVNPNREQMPWPAVPLGLCTVASALSRAGYDVRVLDLTFSSDPRRDVLAVARRFEPTHVGVTVRNIDNCNFESPHFYLPEIREQVMRPLRSALPKATLTVGGSAVNVLPWAVLKYLEADYAIVGEGESAMTELTEAICGERQFSEVSGLLGDRFVSDKALPVLDTGRLLENEPKGGRAQAPGFEDSAGPDVWRWVDLDAYQRRGGPYSIQTKRGCALKCSYCVYNNIEGHRYRLRKPELIVDELGEAKRHGVTSADFVDSTFNLPLSHARAVCDELIRRDLGLDLSTMGLNPAGLSRELLSEMRRAGFKSVMCTPESASETTLATLKKGFKKQHVVRAAQLLREARIPTYWFFMLGAPGETLDTVRETLEFCERYIPRDHMVLFSTGIRVYPGTPLERTCKDQGWFSEKDTLFEPSWYLSPELDLEPLYSMLVKAAKSHPNWMTNAETVTSPLIRAILQRGLRSMGKKGPFWQHLPRLNRVLTRFGLRQHGLDGHETRMSRVWQRDDLRHYRG